MPEISEDDFADVYEHLRGQVRLYGFAEFDLNAAHSFGDKPQISWRLIVQDYITQFIWYLRVFDPGYVANVEEKFDEHLRGERWPWDLERKNTSLEFTREDGRRATAGFPSIKNYLGVAKLRDDLFSIAAEMGLDIPEEPWEPPNDNPTNNGPRRRIQ